MALPELIAAEDLFKASIWDTLVDLAIGALFAKFPFLNIFLVRDAIKWLLHKFSDEMFEFLADMLNLLYVVLKNKALQKQFIDHALRLKGIALESGIDSPAYLAARKEHQQAFAVKVRSLLVPEAA